MLRYVSLQNLPRTENFTNISRAQTAWPARDIGIGHEISLFTFRTKMGKICIIIKYVIDSYPFVRAPSDHVITEPPINGKSSDVRIFFKITIHFGDQKILVPFSCQTCCCLLMVKPRRIKCINLRQHQAKVICLYSSKYV